ncbi:MAG: hypothetical protein LBF22_06470, partial [Deltaproteobacteria bacterium]|nr:hypothetical protein [Deltaproteobacteria bacterium]
MDSQDNATKMENTLPSENAPPFGDIFRHSWPILWETPLRLLCFILFFALFETIRLLTSNYFLEPYLMPPPEVAQEPSEVAQEPSQTGPDGVAVPADVRGDVLPDIPANKSDPASAPTGTEANESLNDIKANLDRNFQELGHTQLFLGFLVSFLFMPLLSLFISKLALSIWDGEKIRFTEFLASIWKYPRALLLSLFLFIYGFFLVTITFFVFGPLLLSLPALNNPGLFSMITIYTLVTGLFWVKFVWQKLKSLIFLQFLAFFYLSERPYTANFFNEIWTLEKNMRAFPAHLTSMLFSLLGMIFLLTALTHILNSVLTAWVVLPEVIQI